MAKIYLKKVKGSVFSCDGCFYYDNLIDCAGNCINKERGYIYIQVPAPEKKDDNTTTLIKDDYGSPPWYRCEKCQNINTCFNTKYNNYCPCCGRKIKYE